jgi:hypothetical protein
VTIRDRDSMQQVRVPEGDLLPTFQGLLEGGDWGEVVARFGGATADAARAGDR